MNSRNLYNYIYLPIVRVQTVRSRPQTHRTSSMNKRARVYRCTHTEREARIEKREDNRLCYAYRIIEPNSRKRPLRDSTARRWHHGSQPRVHEDVCAKTRRGDTYFIYVMKYINIDQRWTIIMEIFHIKKMRINMYISYFQNFICYCIIVK